MAGRTATLTIQILADTAKAQGGIQAFGRNLDAGMIAKGAVAAGAVIAVTAAIVDMTKAAAADAQEQARLEQAFVAAGAATGDYKAAIDASIVAGQDLAFTDTQIRDALTPLIGATGDAAKAQEGLALAQDVARLSGVDLETAAKAVAKAQAGQGTALAKLTQINAKGLTATEVLTAAQAKAAGQAEAYGNTTAGQAESMSIAFDELTEMIGSFFLPILAEILPILKPILKEFGKLITALLPVLIPLVKLLIIPLKILVKVLGWIFEMLAKVIKWFEKVIKAIGEFLEAFAPVRAVGDFIGGIVSGQAAPAPPAPAGLRAGLLAGPTLMATSSPASTSAMVATRKPVKVDATVTHRIDDPNGALAGLPGGAAAVAALLNRGTDATGLFRHLQQAAGVR